MNPADCGGTATCRLRLLPPANFASASGMVMYLPGVGNIRDVELHPRTVGNAEF